MQFIDCKNVTSFITFLLKQKSKSALALAAYLTKQPKLKRDFLLHWRRHYFYVRFEVSDFVDAIQQCQKKLRDEQFKLFVDFLNKMVLKNLFLEIKLNELRNSPNALDAYSFKILLEKLNRLEKFF